MSTTHPIRLASALGALVTGEVIAPDHVEYETARGVWNGMIDKRPLRSCAARTPSTSRRPSASPRSASCRSPSAAAGTTSQAPPWSTVAS